MPDVGNLETVGARDGAAVLPGDLVRDLVLRNEEAIEALMARLGDAEARAEAAEHAVRGHPAMALLEPEEAARVVAELPEAVPVDDGRPRTTVVRRPAVAPAGRDAGRSTGPAPGGVAPTGPLARLTTSHWWWRIGIALVAVSLLLVKFG